MRRLSDEELEQLWRSSKHYRDRQELQEALLVLRRALAEFFTPRRILFLEICVVVGYLLIYISRH